MSDWNWSNAAAVRLRSWVREHATQDAIVEATGIPKATLQRILAGKSDPGEDRLRLICEASGADPAIILKGGDAMADTVVEVPINDIQVSAGPGKLPLDENLQVGRWPFPRDWIETHFGGPEHLRLLPISGDSQEPELRDGDHVLIDLRSNTLKEGMHVVRLDDALMIKRIQLEGARVRLKSANTNYQDIMVDLTADQERFQVVARAVWTAKLLV